MKSIILTFTLGITAMLSHTYSNHSYSELNLKLYDNGLFTVILDNQCMNSPSVHFSFNNLKPGNHALKVMKHYPAYYGFYSPPKIIFSGLIRIPPKSKVFAMIDLYSQFEVYYIMPDYYEPLCSNGNNFNYSGNYHENHYPLSMNSNVFIVLKNSVIHAAFDKDKLNIAKQGIAANGVSAQQALELMNLFTFETNKLKFAKFAYQHTFDKQNYFMVNSGFTFSSSVNELNKYISVY